MPKQFDPSGPLEVQATLLETLNAGQSRHAVDLSGVPVRVGAATSAWVWFVDLVGRDISSDIEGPQVLRIHDKGESDLVARQVKLSERLIAMGFPVAQITWHGELGGHPAQLQRRLPGRPAVELLGSIRLRRTVRSLAALQARLHAINPDGFDIPRVNAASFLADDIGRRRSRVNTTDPTRTLDWLHETLEKTTSSTDQASVLCHGDFHPLNALVDDVGSIGVVDWTDACIADRHHDVARTIAIYWLASLIAESTVERVGLRLVRSWLGRVHRSAYEVVSGVRLDDRRLAWWQIVHLYRGWLQLCELAEGAVPERHSSTTVRLPQNLNDRLLRRCVALRSQV